MISPGIPIRRLTKTVSATSSVRNASPPRPLGWKTMMSPRAGSLRWYRKRAAMMRSLTSSVSVIDSDGMRYGLTIHAWTQ